MWREIDRRSFLRAGSALVGALVVGRVPGASAAPAAPGPSPYGSLEGIAPDANGIVLPPGFTSRVVAQAGQQIPGTGYTWHTDPDGGAVFPTPDNGWIYVSNHEERIDLVGGGAGAIKFNADGEVVDAYRILDGTYTNCSGGPTPWGTWLSCEEHPFGQVWECDPAKPGQGVARPAMGRFWHEAVTVDPVRGHVYMTEDAFNGEDGRFYRFTPTTYPDLSAGVLEAAVVDGEGAVTWIEVDTSVPITRLNASEATLFNGAEGVWYDDGVVFFTTKSDDKVWRYDVVASTISVLYDPADMDDPPLTGVDNCLVAASGDLFVAEDGGNMELVIVTPDGVVAPFLRVVGHDESEISGLGFDPSGTRLYFSSMRGTQQFYSVAGLVYEVTGPFRRTATSGGGGGGGGGGAGGGGAGGLPAVQDGGADRNTPATGGGISPWWVLGLLGAAGLARAGARVSE